MNIDELTMRQAREIAKLLACNGKETATVHPAVGHYCLIRSYAAGVHVGMVASVTDSLSGREVELRETRRIWSWSGALSCSEIALSGITGGKLSAELPSNFVNQAIEIITMSKEAERCLRNWSK